MKPDPHSSDVSPSQDVADLPPKRKWFGYAAVAASLAITYALWLGAMGATDEWYDNPWHYPAKVGSHGTLILMCWAFILATRFRLLRKLDSTPEGLSAEEAAKRLEDVGPNRLPEPPKEGLLIRFFKHFHDLLIYILIAAAAVTAVLGHWVDTGVILGVVIINAIIGFIQEGKAEQALAGIRKMLSPHAQARRDGAWAEMESENLVPGDIVRLRSGDRVPADLRLIDTANLRLEESALTGESVPAEKKNDPADTNAGIGDRHGMAYSGTMVAAGRGTGVVTATGPDTELGRINQMISEVETLATPLTRQMQRFGKILSIVVVGMAVLM